MGFADWFAALPEDAQVAIAVMLGLVACVLVIVIGVLLYGLLERTIGDDDD